MRFYFNKAEMVIFFCGIFVDSFVQCVYFTRYIKVDQLVLCEAGEKVAFTSCRDGERGRKGGGGVHFIQQRIFVQGKFIWFVTIA